MMPTRAHGRTTSSTSDLLAPTMARTLSSNSLPTSTALKSARSNLAPSPMDGLFLTLMEDLYPPTATPVLKPTMMANPNSRRSARNPTKIPPSSAKPKWNTTRTTDRTSQDAKPLPNFSPRREETEERSSDGLSLRPALSVLAATLCGGARRSPPPSSKHFHPVFSNGPGELLALIKFMSYL